MNKIKLKDNISILYNEEKISVSRNNHIKTLCNERCSAPSLNPKNNKFVYLSPLEWEEISKLKLYNIEEDILNEIEINNISDQDTIKQVQWISDCKLIMIVGFANGTVTVGGDIFTYDIYSKEYNNIYKSLDGEEVKHFDIKDDTLEMEVITFDEDFNGYTRRKENIKIRDKEVLL